jgi:hypothetical protein
MPIIYVNFVGVLEICLKLITPSRDCVDKLDGEVQLSLKETLIILNTPKIHNNIFGKCMFEEV